MNIKLFDGTKSPADLIGMVKSFLGLDSEITSNQCSVCHISDMACGSAMSALFKSAMVSVQAENIWQGTNLSH